MLYQKLRVVGFYLRFIDALALGTTSAGIWWLGVRGGVWTSDHVESMALFSVAVACALLFVGASTRAYHQRRTEHLVEELGSLLEISLYATGLACVVTEIFSPGLPSRAYAAILLANLVALALVRLTMRAYVRRLRSKGSDYQSWLIVGHNSRSARLANAILAHPHFGIRIEEIIDLPEKTEPRSYARRTALEGLPSAIPSRTVEDFEAVREILTSRIIDEVVITLPYRSYYDEIQQILNLCCEAGISVKLQPEAFEALHFKTEMSQVGEIPVVTHFTGPAQYNHLAIKRGIDVLVSAFALFVLSPLFLLIGAIIKLTSAGPVFYVQERVGLHGRIFRLVKFRSMRLNSHSYRNDLRSLNAADAVAFKVKDDPRITPIGRLLRKFHFDELPQFWNVLIGDMSLVGPRPLIPTEACGNEWWQRRRLSMPPGMTCFWQVANDHCMPFRQWMQLDLAYIDRWSVWLDLKLIAHTVRTVVRGDGW